MAVKYHQSRLHTARSIAYVLPQVPVVYCQQPQLYTATCLGCILLPVMATSTGCVLPLVTGVYYRQYLCTATSPSYVLPPVLAVYVLSVSYGCVLPPVTVMYCHQSSES